MANDKKCLITLAIRILIIFQRTHVMQLGKTTNGRHKYPEIRKTVTGTQKREKYCEVLMIIMHSNKLERQQGKHVHRY